MTVTTKNDRLLMTEESITIKRKKVRSFALSFSARLGPSAQTPTAQLLVTGHGLSLRASDIQRAGHIGAGMRRCLNVDQLRRVHIL